MDIEDREWKMTIVKCWKMEMEDKKMIENG